MSNYTGKILIAEDEMDIAQIVKYLLENKGNAVKICSDGQEALDLIPQFKPDLLILDVMMPKMSGYALVKELKKDEEFAQIPILMVSGVSKGSDKTDDFWQRGMGVDDYITKPFDPKDLVRRVEVLLRKKQEGWLTMERNGTLPAIASEGKIKAAGSISVKEMQVPAANTITLEEEVTTPENPAAYPTEPEDVVTLFVEAWNTQTFEKEYECLSTRLAFTNQQDYVQRRRGYWAELNSRETNHQNVQKVTSKKVKDNIAQVEIIRIDTEGKIRRMSKVSYTLIQQDGKWKINAVKDIL